MPVFARVFASTRFTITAHASEGPGEPSGSGLPGKRAGNHHGIGRNFADERLARRPVDDLRRRAQEHPHRKHRAFAHDHAFGHFRARADERTILDDHRPGLQRLQHTADSSASGNMHVGADLRATADGCPGIHHRPRADMRADVHEARHQHGARRHIGPAPDDGAGHHAETGLGKAIVSPAQRLQRNLVPRRCTCALGNGIACQAEAQQNRLLQPLVHLPLAPGIAFSHA
jgi:hypothetical protein